MRSEKEIREKIREYTLDIDEWAKMKDSKEESEENRAYAVGMIRTLWFEIKILKWVLEEEYN